MSRKINVNPGQYKVRGRERQGEDVLHEQNKQAFSQQAAAERWQAQQQPGWRRRTRRNRPQRNRQRRSRRLARRPDG